MSYSIDFQTTTGAGDEIVKVIMTYQRDESGIYAENIESITFNGMDVMGLLSQDQFADLEIEGCKAIHEQAKFAMENYEP